MGAKRKCSMCKHADLARVEQTVGQPQKVYCTLLKVMCNLVCPRFGIGYSPTPVTPSYGANPYRHTPRPVGVPGSPRPGFSPMSQTSRFNGNRPNHSAMPHVSNNDLSV